MKKPIISLLMLVFWQLFANAQSVNGVVVSQKQNIISIENGLIAINYDLSKGTYSAIDKVKNVEAITSAFSWVNDFKSSDEGGANSFTTEAFEDKLGKGVALMISSKKENHPEQLLKMKMFANQAFIVMQSGIKNTKKEPYVLKYFSPLANASTFQKLNFKEHIKLLDGEGGAAETAIRNEAYLTSQNNLLLNFNHQKSNYTLIAGGLTYQEFEKFASITDGRSREKELSKLADGLPLLEYIDAGHNDFWHQTKYCTIDKSGKIFNISYDGGFPEAKTIVYDKNEIILSFKNLNPNKTYTLGLTLGAYDSSISQSINLLGEKNKELLAPIKLPNLPAGDQAKIYFLLITPEMMKDGMPKIQIKKESGSNCILNELALFEGIVSKEKFDLPINAKDNRIVASTKLELNLYAEDPIGKLVDLGQTYLPEEDAFYLDFSTVNPLLAAEKYAQAVKKAQQVQLNSYYFPTICLWYAMQPHYGGKDLKIRAINDTPGAVDEMERVKKSGWLKYTTMGIRLVPDSYGENNENGWWDDKHWQLHGSGDEQSQGGKGMELIGGHYRKPFETSKKWAQAITDLGGLPFTYFQTGVRSKDYAAQFPQHMLYNQSYYKVENQLDRFNANYGTYDFTDTGFVNHLKKVYKNLNNAGVVGMMFDYPHTAWAPYGGMDDIYATTASHYRKVFELASSGLGKDSYVQERNLTRGSDLTVGIVESQRIWGDTDGLNSEMVKRGGLRWYKNRVLFNYDMDAKSINNAQINEGQDGVNKLLTMSYVTGSRLLIGESFAKLDSQQIYQLSRVFPFHQTSKSARPIDAFSNDYPRVYDFEVDSTWHQLTFYNEDNNHPKTITASFSGSPGFGGLGLNQQNKYYVYDFWNNNLIGIFNGTDSLTQTLRKGEARMMSVHQKKNHPQVLSTDRHLMQGYIELSDVKYSNSALSGRVQMVEGETMKIIIATNGKNPKSASLQSGKASFKLLDDNLMELSLISRQGGKSKYNIQFE